MKRRLAYFFLVLSLLVPCPAEARPMEDERALMVGMIDAVDLFAQGEYKDASRIFSSLVRRYPDAVGGYLYMIFGRLFDETQRQLLDSLGYDKLIPDVSTRGQKK